MTDCTNIDSAQSKVQRKDLFFAVAAIGIISAELLLLEFFLSNGLLSVDGYNYIIFTRSVLKKGWSLSFEEIPSMRGFPPLLPILMLFGAKCGLSLSIAGRLLNIAGTMLACQGILFICFTLYKSRQTAFFTALMVCSLPKIYFEGCGILRDPLFWAEMTWCVYFILQIARNPGKTTKEQFIKNTIIVLLASLGCLTRKEGLPFLLLILSILTCLNLKNVFIPLKWRILVSLFILVFSGVFVFLPYFFGIPFVPGDFILYMIESAV